ncbi:MAG: SDR family NAD(P)-dependent oxidoreductase [Bacteroidia bacterium]
MNESILITGANAGLGKETARQLALKPETKRIILACRNSQKAETAKKDLEESTGKNLFEILIMDVSNADSVKNAVAEIEGSIDAVILNAGGMGGKNAGRATPSGMNEISAVNSLGHVVLVDELIAANKLNKVVMLASSEAARGIKKMGMTRPTLKENSTDELASILDGSYFKKFDPMQAYGHVKYVATLWMSSMARKHPNIKFISMSPGATSGTAAADNAPGIMKFMFKYIMMPIVMPLRGMVHNVTKGAERFVDAINSTEYENGKFYASAESKVIGPVMDQSLIMPVFSNQQYQDNANEALHRFI